MTAAAIICPQSTENFEMKVSRPTGNVIRSSVEISMSANSSSRPGGGEHEAERGARCPGRVSGTMTRRSAWKRVQPSIIAASSSSTGMPSRKDCMRKVAKGTLKAV